MYISNTLGNDNWPCDRLKPCKTIWRAVTLASSGDHIYLDGNDTDKAPYTCQSGKRSEHPGIYISKNVSLMGYGPIPPHIRCLPGSSFVFHDPDNPWPISVTLSGIFFNETTIKFQDSSANIDGCTFEGNHTCTCTCTEFLARRDMLFNIQVTNSIFYTNGHCPSVVVKSYQSQPLRTVIGQEPPHVVSSNITMKNVSFYTKFPTTMSFFYLDFERGHQNLYIQNTTCELLNDSPDTFSSTLDNFFEKGCSDFTLRGYSLNIILNESRFSNRHARVLNISAFSTTLQISNSQFFGHRVIGEGGVMFLKVTHSCKVDVLNTNFTNAFSTRRGGAISIVGSNTGNNFTSTNAMNGTSIHIENSVFKNCSAGQGGAIFLSHLKGKVGIAVKKSKFVDNYAHGGFHSYRGYGGAIGLLLAQAVSSIYFRCAKKIKTGGQVKECPLKNNLIIEDTIFQKNAGEFGGAVYLVNGHATLRNCSFIDNFASADGGHIYADEGTTSLEIQGSVFNKTIKHLQFDVKNYTKASFIHLENAGPLKLYNTTLDARSYSEKISLIAVYEGRQIDFGSDNLTVFYCPNGSQLDVPFNFTTNKNVDNVRNVTATTLRYECVPCSVHMYSLQRGTAFGGFVNPDFQCLQCPFGADCTRNISAKLNFWGFKKTNNPPALNFTMCPLGYCRSPDKTNFHEEYNGCQGKRSGELCGQCKEAYTEALYSTNCRPSHECKDYWFWPVALVYVFLMALYFTYKPLVLPWICRQILWFKEYQPNIEHNFDSGYLKIIFYFYQAADLILISSSSKSVIKTHLIEPLVGIFNFQQKISTSGSPCPFPGLTVVYKMLFSSLPVFGTLLMICIIYALHCGARKIQGKKSPSPDPYFGGVLRTMLLGYSTLGSISFNLLRCVPIGSEKRLFYDGNIVCFQWWQYILVAIICTFLLPFGFVLLWGSFKLYSGTISMGHFLLACSLPLPLLIYWVFVSLFCRANNNASQDSSPQQVLRNSVEKVLYDCFKKPNDGGKLSLSWESVMIGRRLILIALKAFVNDPMPRLLIMSFFCVLFLLHHALTQPFRDGVANTVETISLLCVVVLAIENVFFASFLSLGVPIVDDHFNYWLHIFKGMEIVLLCSVPAVFGFLLIAALLSQMCRLIVMVQCFVRNSCRDLYRPSHHYSSLHDQDRTKPLLAPF